MSAPDSELAAANSSAAIAGGPPLAGLLHGVRYAKARTSVAPAYGTCSPPDYSPRPAHCKL